ncbi:MAG: NAD(P)/FAD-dependent oxidoreductase [Nannocystaceae bacterium]|nr:FAD-binding oxidoreductase [bacterium]
MTHSTISARASEPLSPVTAPTRPRPRALAPEPDYALEPVRKPGYLPQTDDRSPWLDGPSMPIGTPLTANTFVDVAIVGAGFTGLMCAHALARLRPSWQIMLIDALAVGEAASGRNSGYLMDVGHWQPKWGVETNRGVADLSTLGIERIEQIVEGHGIDCDWHAGGRYHVAVNARGRRALATFREGMKAMGRDFVEMDPTELAARLGTQHYTEGMHVDGGALLNPAKLVRGLAEALPESVRVVERQQVDTITPGTTHRLQAGRYQVSCSQLVLATNGFLPALGLERGRVLPFATYASVTEPLPRQPGSEAQWGVVPEEKMGATVRLLPDNRLLIRNGVRYRNPPQIGASVCAAMAKDHRASLARRFPEFADVPFSHTWGGTLGVTTNNATVFGRFGDGAWACGAHNGVGMSLGGALGHLLAHEVAGEKHTLAHLARSLPQPAWTPPEPFRSVGISAYTWFLGLLAGEEK